MKIKMAVAKDNIEKCIEAGVYGTNEGRIGLNVKKLCELEKGDKLILYASGISKFAGIVEITKPFYESNDTIGEDGVYPYRVGIKPVIYLPKDKWLDAKDFVFALDYFKNKVQWSMHFINNLTPVELKDYEYLKSEMEKVFN